MPTIIKLNISCIVGLISYEYRYSCAGIFICIKILALFIIPAVMAQFDGFIIVWRRFGAYCR